MLAVMQSFTRTALEWVGLVAMRLGDFLAKKGGIAGLGRERVKVFLIFPPNLGG